MLDKEGLNGEISVGVTFASLMAAISLFFTGVLIAQFQSFGPTIKVPLLFLIISTFSFIFAATIYNNAGTEVTLGKLKTVEKYMVYAKNIVEFLGLYPLILSTPLVIGAVTQDTFLRASTTIVAIVGMALYSQSKFSTLEKQLSAERKRLYSVAVVMLALFLYLSQALTQVGAVLPYNGIALVLLVILLVPAVYFSVKSKQYRVVVVRPFRMTDAEALAGVVARILAKAVQGRQPEAVISHIRDNASTDVILQLAKEQEVYVAVTEGRRVGFLALEDNTISSIWTDPGLQRKGVGRMLVQTAEAAASEFGHEDMRAFASSANVKFFEKLGYTRTEENDEHIVLHKDL